MKLLARSYADACDQFWSEHSALLYGICFYLGSVGALLPHLAISIPFILLLLPCLIWGNSRTQLRMILAIAISAAAFCYVLSHVKFPLCHKAKQMGTAIVEVSDIAPAVHYGRVSYKLTLFLHTFESDDGRYYAKNIRCKWMCNDISRRPIGGHLYSVRGHLSENEGGWSFKMAPNSSWDKLESLFSLVEWRYRAKSYFKRLMAVHLPPGQVRSFLEGVLIGEFHDQLLSSQLRRFGLQHILVASGFHFTLITTLFMAFCSLWLPWRAATVSLILLTTGYLLFIGPTPSVLRAWCSTTLFLFAKLLSHKSNGLNGLGIGALVVLWIDPSAATALSFQLSFLATMAILLLYQPLLELIRSFFPSHAISDAIEFPFMDQLALVLLSFFCSSVALVLSVSVVMLPMSLFAFQSFPLMGILYNCFFPFVVSIAIALLCMALLFSWTPVGALFFFAASWLTEASLTLVTHAPAWLDITIYRGGLSLAVLSLYLSLLFGFFMKRKSAPPIACDSAF